MKIRNYKNNTIVDFNDNQGKRPDQISFSEKVVFGCIIVLLLLALFGCSSFPEYDLSNRKDTITIMFDRGTDDLERTIIALQRAKGNRLGLIGDQYFSHVSIMIDSMVWQTHPRHGVICNRFYVDSYNIGREWVDILVPSKQSIKEQLQFLDSTQNEYYIEGAAFQSIYMTSNIWFGNKKPDKFYCSKLVAYVLGMPEYYKNDMLDIWLMIQPYKVK